VTKLADFGLAKQLGEGAETEGKDGKQRQFHDLKETIAQGSTMYMAPERLMAQEQTFVSDIWSLGITLVECVLGQSAYEGPIQSEWDLLNDPKLRITRKDVSPQFFDFIQQCLEKDVNKRPGASQLMKHPFIKRYIQNPDIFTPFRTKRWIESTYLKQKDQLKLSEIEKKGSPSKILPLAKSLPQSEPHLFTSASHH